MNPLLFLMEIKQNKRQKNVLLSRGFFFQYLTWSLSSINLKSAYGSGFFCWAVVVSLLTVCIPACRLRENNYLKQGSCTNLPPVIHLFFLPPLSLSRPLLPHAQSSASNTHISVSSPHHIPGRDFFSSFFWLFLSSVSADRHSKHTHTHIHT